MHEIIFLIHTFDFQVALSISWDRVSLEEMTWSKYVMHAVIIFVLQGCLAYLGVHCKTPNAACRSELARQPCRTKIITACITYLDHVISSSRTVGSAKKFVRITSGFGGGDFTKTLRKECTCQKLKFSFLLLEYCKIRECYVDLSRLKFTSDESEFIPDYI
jgi:hypothetical protein